MSLSKTTLLLMSQHELIQRYENMVISQQDLITALWNQIYSLLKHSLTRDMSELEKAEVLAQMSYAALCAQRPQEAMAAANEGLGLITDESIELITRLMRNLEQAQHDAEK